MENEDFETKKQKILDKIFVEKKDTLENLGEIVQKSLNHFIIDPENNHRIDFKPHIKKVSDKINLLLIALFFMKERGIVSNDQINISEMSKKLNIKKTTLSKPLGILIAEGYVKKDSESNYSIIHHKINHVLKRLENG